MRRAIHSLFPLALAAMLPSVALGQCPTPDPTLSYFVPQTGPVAAPTEGNAAIALFRACPNNDGGASLPNNARIKVVLFDAGGLPIVGEFQVYVLFNGGTPAQGFFGIGADSIISNSTWNVTPLCPDVTYINADTPTDASGTTYIMFTGGTPAAPGVAHRDSTRKWGHYDNEIPVYVGRPPCAPIQLKGRLTSGSPLPSYTLRIRNIDVVGGLGPILNQGETVRVNDFNKTVACTGGGPDCQWCDFDNSGVVNVVDINIISAHLLHDCDTPLSP